MPNWGNVPKFGAKFIPELLRYFLNGAFLLGLVRLAFGAQIIVSLKNLVPNWGNALKFGATIYTRIAPLFFNGAFLLSIV